MGRNFAFINSCCMISSAPNTSAPMYQQQQNNSFQSNGMNRSNNGNYGGRQQQQPKDDPSIGKKLFVGGLPPTCTKENLEQHFGSYGQTTDVVVMVDGQTQKSRGFGFVTFETVESVDACQRARPHEILGKQVDTKRAQPRGQQNTNSNDKVPNNKVFCRQLPYEITDEEFKAYALTFGEVDSIFVNRKDRKDGNTSSTCFGFITFVDYDDADKMALHANHSINGNNIIVQKSIVKPRGPPGGQMQSPQQGGYGGNGRQFGGYQQGGYNQSPAQSYQPYHQNNQNSYSMPPKQQYNQQSFGGQQQYGNNPNNNQRGYNSSSYQGGYTNKPSNAYGAPSSGYGSSPQQGGYASGPQQGGYGAAPQQGGYGAAPQQGGYSQYGRK